jgi:Ca2+-binding EF-hand superfamily protein
MMQQDISETFVLLDDAPAVTGGIPKGISGTRLAQPEAASFSATAFLADAQDQLRTEHKQEARALRKELDTKRRADHVKASEHEQTLTTLEEIWECLCASHGPSPFKLEALTFIDLFRKCQLDGLRCRLASALKPKAELLFDLEPRDVAYLCYLVFEGEDSASCGERLVVKLSDPDFLRLTPKAVLQVHADTCLGLRHFKSVLPAIADVMELDVAYVVSAFVWVEAKRFEMPEQLYEEFFLKNNQTRFIRRDDLHLLSADDHEHIPFGQLVRNDFVRLCHNLGLIDHRKQSGKAWEYWVLFWDDLLNNMQQHVNDYAERRPGRRLSAQRQRKGSASRRRGSRSSPSNSTTTRDFLHGRTELTVMLEMLFRNMPDQRYKSPLDICWGFLSNFELDADEALAPLREACWEFEPSESRSTGAWALSQNTMKQLFQERDRNHNGSLEYDELAGLLKAGNPAIPDSTIRTLFELADHNNDGLVDFNEFVDFIVGDESFLHTTLGKDQLANSMEFRDKRHSAEIKRQFQEKDKDGNGLLDYQELSELIKAGDPSISDEEIDTLFRHADVDVNGNVDFNEFVDFISSERSSAATWCRKGRAAW